MPLKQRFISVPDRSQVCLRIAGPETGFIISAELRRGSTLLKNWRHEELMASEQCHVLRTPEVYTLIVDVAFTQSQQIDVDALIRILKQDGSQHSKTKKLSFSGARPADQHGRVQIITEQP